jgi:hypothetical protein
MRRNHSDFQDFEALRDDCLAKGKLFRDPEFKPSSKICGDEDYADIEWLRPREICDNPKFVVQSFTKSDVLQGGLGNCWFLAALAALAENDELFRQVVPDDNDFEKNYAGIFHFR